MSPAVGHDSKAQGDHCHQMLHLARNKMRLYGAPMHVGQVRATFSEQGPDDTFRSSSWAGVTNENPKMSMYIYYNTFIAKQANQ